MNLKFGDIVCQFEDILCQDSTGVSTAPTRTSCNVYFQYFLVLDPDVGFFGFDPNIFKKQFGS